MSTADPESEIAQLRAENEALKKRLGDMEDMAKVGELSANMAHEIRNPLAGISSLAEVLRMKAGGDSDTEEIVDTILEEVDRLNRIVKDLLRFARPAKAFLAPTDLLDSINQVLTFVKDRLESENFTVTKELPESCPPVMADADQARQVFLNLLMNAMDATGPGGALTVRATLPEGSKFVQVEFTDNGPGISEENLLKIFDPFFTTKAQGTGLGLAACRKIIEHHGGEIKVQSTEGEGTTFTITLPLAE